MGTVALNTITETLEIEEERWDIWSIAALTNDEGNGFRVFTYTQVYGNNNVVSSSEWNSNLTDIQDDIIEALQAECEHNVLDCADIEVVASVPYFRQDAILGLNVAKWANLDKLRGLTVMRVDDRPSELASIGDGCPLLPIAIRVDQWALYPSNWLEETGEEEDEGPFTPFKPTFRAWARTRCSAHSHPSILRIGNILPVQRIRDPAKKMIQ